jgi:hypothetical protein
VVPALEVAIGLAVLFLVLSLSASAVVEIIGNTFKLRASGLERAVGSMLGQADAGQEDVTKMFLESATIKALREADTAWTILGKPKRSKTVVIEGKRKMPARIPARAFADGVVDVLTKVKSSADTSTDLYGRLPSALQDRLKPMLEETGSDLLALKAKLEQWFDDSMRNLDEMYRRWSKKLLFIIGLVLTIMLNASTIGVAQDLWSDSLTRESVVAAADQLAQEGSPGNDDPADSFEDVADELAVLDAAGIPLGWGDIELGWVWLTTSVLGWFITACLVMLGAPFWYDILTRMFAARRALVPTATQDPASATTLVRSEATTRGVPMYGQADRSVDTPPANPANNLFSALPLRQ